MKGLLQDQGELRVISGESAMIHSADHGLGADQVKPDHMLDQVLQSRKSKGRICPESSFRIRWISVVPRIPVQRGHYCLPPGRLVPERPFARGGFIQDDPLDLSLVLHRNGQDQRPPRMLSPESASHRSSYTPRPVDETVSQVLSGVGSSAGGLPAPVRLNPTRRLSARNTRSN